MAFDERGASVVHLSFVAVARRAAVVVAFSLALASTARAASEKNKCGCYRDESSGACYCEKKAKCGCPGECEPKGCEEQRDKNLQKEIDAETKRATQTDRRQRNEGGGADRDDDDRGGTVAPGNDSASKAAGAAAGKKLSGAQVKQLAKLLELYLAEHPDARGKSADDLRGELGAASR